MGWEVRVEERNDKVVYTTPIEKCKLRKPTTEEQAIIHNALREKRGVVRNSVKEIIQYGGALLILLLVVIVLVIQVDSVILKLLVLGVLLLYLVAGVGGIARWVAVLDANHNLQQGQYQMITGVLDGKDDTPRKASRNSASKYEARFYISTEDGKHARVVGDSRWDCFEVGDRIIVLVYKQRSFLVKKEC